MVGVAFKPGTDDMRESPYVIVARRLIEEGIAARVYDPGVHPERLIGSNRELVRRALGSLEQVLVHSLDELIECDIILVNHPIITSGDLSKWLSSGIRVIDLVGIDGVARDAAGYEGICW